MIILRIGSVAKSGNPRRVGNHLRLPSSEILIMGLLFGFWMERL